MITKIVVPEIGEIKFDSDQVPGEWVGDSYSNYMNSEPPYKGESPRDDNFLKIKKSGEEVLVFNSTHPGAICMFINELFVDMYCVYDCENISWPYGGMPYGCMECGYSSVDEMPTFCKDILDLFIEQGIVLKLKGDPIGDYYIISHYKDYMPLDNSFLRRKQPSLWKNIIEPKVVQSCEHWLRNRIIEIFDEHINTEGILGGADGFWYQLPSIGEILTKSDWARDVFFKTINDYIRDETITLYYISGKVRVFDKELLIVDFPEDYILTHILFSRKNIVLQNFGNNDSIELKKLLPSDASLPFAKYCSHPVNFSFYMKKSGRIIFDVEKCEYVVYRDAFNKDEIIATISDLQVNKLKSKTPINTYDFDTYNILSVCKETR